MRDVGGKSCTVKKITAVEPLTTTSIADDPKTIYYSYNSKCHSVTLVDDALREPEDESDLSLLQHHDRCTVTGRPLWRGTASGLSKSVGGTMLCGAKHLKLRQFERVHSV